MTCGAHHWAIASNDAPFPIYLVTPRMLPARCLYCGAERLFPAAGPAELENAKYFRTNIHGPKSLPVRVQ